MDDEKCCNDECCERDEPTATENPEHRLGPGLFYAPDYQGQTLTFNNASGELGVNHSNRIHDTVIKEMDYGYLVKAGCQTLCISKKEHLLMLFEAYLNDPSKVWEAHAKGKLEDVLTDKTVEKFKKNEESQLKPTLVVAVVGKSKTDVDNYMTHNVFQVVKKKGNFYETEDRENIYRCYAIAEPKHLCSLVLDNVIETHQARENKHFAEIIEMCNTQIRR